MGFITLIRFVSTHCGPEVVVPPSKVLSKAPRTSPGVFSQRYPALKKLPKGIWGKPRCTKKNTNIYQVIQVVTFSSPIVEGHLTTTFPKGHVNSPSQKRGTKNGQDTKDLTNITAKEAVLLAVSTTVASSFGEEKVRFARKNPLKI